MGTGTRVVICRHVVDDERPGASAPRVPRHGRCASLLGRRSFCVRVTDLSPGDTRARRVSLTVSLTLTKPLLPLGGGPSVVSSRSAFPAATAFQRVGNSCHHDPALAVYSIAVLQTGTAREQFE